MRLVVGMLACLGVGALTLALADPPASTPQASAPASAPTSSTAAAAPSKPADTSVKLSNITPDENHFIQEGYHFETHRNGKVLCRYEVDSGSRVERTKTCGTVAELKAIEGQSQQAFHSGQTQGGGH